MVSRLIVENLSVLLPEHIRLRGSLYMALERNCVSVAASQVLQVLNYPWQRFKVPANGSERVNTVGKFMVFSAAIIGKLRAIKLQAD